MERLQASIYIFLYTLFLSFPFLLVVLWRILKNYVLKRIFVKLNLFYVNVGIWWIFFIIIFLVKFPIYFLHLWLPKAHVEAPVAGSIILAGVLLKLGGYGWFLFLNFLRKRMNRWWILFFFLGLLGGLITIIICFRQVDLKCFIAYSSVAHIGLVIRVFSCIEVIGIQGGVLIMLAHGVASSGLFYGLNLIYERILSRRMLILKGIFMYSSLIVLWWFILILANILTAEQIVVEALIFFSLANLTFFSILILGIMVFFGGVYRVLLFSSLNPGVKKSFFFYYSLSVRERKIFFSHVIPLILYLFLILI